MNSPVVVGLYEALTAESWGISRQAEAALAAYEKGLKEEA